MGALTDRRGCRAAPPRPALRSRSMLRFETDPCTCCFCVRFRATNVSVWARSSASSRSAWNTSPPRSKRAATRHARRSALQPFPRSTPARRRARRSSASPPCMRSRPTTSWRWRRAVRRLAPDVPIVVGGHSAAAYPEPFLATRVNAVVLDDGERAVPRIADALARRRPLADVPGLPLRTRSGEPQTTAARPGTFVLDDVPLPARQQVATVAAAVRLPRASADVAGRNRARLPVPLFVLLDLAAARALGARAFDRVGLPGFRGVGDHVFVADDLFWYHPSRSLALAKELRAPRHPQALDPRPEPRRSGGAARRSCSKRGSRWRATSTSSSASKRRRTRA